MGTRVFRESTESVNIAPNQPDVPLLNSKGKVDNILLLVMLVLVIFGLMMVYSASYDISQQYYDDPMYQFSRQALWMILGISSAAVLSIIDYRNWHKFALGLMAFTIGSLIIVIILGAESFNAVRTFLNGSIQPSELAKVVTVIYLSVWLNSKREQLHDMQWGMIPLAVILGIIGGLIAIQPDISAGITIFMLGGLLFFLGGGDLKQITTLLIVAIIFGVIVITIIPTGRVRMEQFTSGFADPTKASYHMLLSYEAIAKGGWFGEGLGRATSKYISLPFPSTDSIFAVIIEELGFVGAMGTVILYLLLIWRGLRIAEKAPDMLGSLLASGLTLWIALEAMINMLVIVGLMPFAGNSLPFISYGGSNIVSSFIAIGILLNVSRTTQSHNATEEWRNFGESTDLRGRNRRRGLSRFIGS